MTRTTITIVVPEGYASGEEFAKDCGVETAPELQEFVEWVDTWVSHPVTSYSVHALDGLFRMARDKLTALRR